MEFREYVEAIIEWGKSECDSYGISDIVDENDIKESAGKQDSDIECFDHEYVYQVQEYTDCYYGSMYFHIGEGKYIQCHYTM